MVPWEIIWVFVLILLTFAAMVWERLPVDLVAMSAFCALLITGVLNPGDAFRVFSNEAVVTIASMFVLSAALERAGAMNLLAKQFQRLGTKTDVAMLVMILPLVAVVSAFVNNTPIVVVFMPIMISLAAQHQIKPSKLLIPLSYASIFGGCCTLIGTSTNLLVSGIADQMGQPPLRMFELTRIGPLLGVAGMVYLLTIGRHLLPNRETLGSLLQSTTSRQYLTEVVVLQNSPLVGKLIPDTPLTALRNARILDVSRASETLDEPLNTIELQAGDRLRLTTVVSSVMEIKSLKGVEILPGHSDLGLEPIGMEKAAVVECVIGPDSPIIGRTMADVNFRQRFGVLVLAVHRRGVNLRENLDKVRFEFGDTLLLEGSQHAIGRLRSDRSFLILGDVPSLDVRKDKLRIGLAVVAAVVVLAALNVLPIAALALTGALIVVLTGCIEAEDAYKAVNWRIVFLIFGMLGLGMALDKTGGDEMLSNGMMAALEWVPPAWRPLVMLATVYLFTNVLTEFLSNNAVAVLVAPVVISAAITMGLDPRPFIIAVALAASASFATPIGYQTNTLVYGAGGYFFRDFLRVGAPLNLLYWILAVLLIPVFWPLQ